MLTFNRVIAVFAACALLPLSAWACGGSSDPEQVVQAQLEAYNKHDIDAFAACYADEVTLTDLSGKRPVIKGIPALKATFAYLAKKPKTFGITIVKRIVNGPIVIDREHVIGVPEDPGRPDAVAVYEVRDGKILNVWFPPSK
ncbi:nuclear transport factor 2 family protein [Dyella silvatica]|uniref:nuclear transport factor 2 family protein n=1 Tax=Dyella silvatica TaxID=2992128 RepID=UPI00224D63F4|nr:nuclear transport factor 2 family protein [Dyella silvatica]